MADSNHIPFSRVVDLVSTTCDAIMCVFAAAAFVLASIEFFGR